MWKIHFATANHAEAAELEACTYLAATWHGKKGHSSLRNSLRTWRHPLVIRREATERVFPAPSPTAPPPQAWLAPGRAVGARQGAGGLWDAAFAIRSLTLGCCQPLTGCQGRSHPGLDSANSALWAELGCHQAQPMAEHAGAWPDAGVRMPPLAVPSRLSWAMGKLAAASARRDSQPIPMEAAVCLAGRGLV